MFEVTCDIAVIMVGKAVHSIALRVLAYHEPRNHDARYAVITLSEYALGGPNHLTSNALHGSPMR